MMPPPAAGAADRSAGRHHTCSSPSRRRAECNVSSRGGLVPRAGFVSAATHSLLAILLVGFYPAGCQSFITSPPVGGDYFGPALRGGNSGSGEACAKVLCRLAAAGGEFSAEAGAGGAKGQGSPQGARRRITRLQVKSVMVRGNAALCSGLQ